MATNAPYYQVRVGQLATSTNNSNAAVQSGISQDEDHILASATVTEHPIENQHLPSYPKHAIYQSGVEKQTSTSEENHNLAELLEAATTAAGQASMTINPDETASDEVVSQGKSKRKIGSDGTTDTPDTSRALAEDQEIPSSKRRRIDPSPTDPSLQVADVDTTMGSTATYTSQSPPRGSPLLDARAAGVHSAAALFRRTSSLTARKYTRPPMSKLFMSLNITPENFIALQALAKAYMLSPAHPERQSCVGNRGKGDTDMVKLRLFNCVRNFLADDGVGEQFFGEHAEKLGDRESSEAAAALGEEFGRGEKLVWPKDGNKIISLVTPLMRRMVTNERQRLYAIDTRKGGKKPEKEGSVEAPPTPDTPANDVNQHAHTALDPTLQRTQPQISSPSVPTSTDARPYLSTTTPPPTSDIPTISSPTVAELASPPAPSDATEPHLTHINIFLTYTPSNSKQSLKLDEKRISTTRPAHLTFYNYTAFTEQVVSMVDQASTRPPFLKAHRATSEPLGAEDTENLRGLAAAANALQPDKDDQTRPCTPTQGASPQYTVKTIGPTGWQVIDSAESWYHVLTERAFATWADGVCNIIVELGRASSQIVVRKEGSVSEGRNGDVQMEEA
ncbi:hypothetical protein EJ07DRAFT_150395 [Lizonia empirigonia]|nr:hypothetical protein EJ07DRAFT_150395 [Lizonia empirigonia]